MSKIDGMIPQEQIDWREPKKCINFLGTSYIKICCATSSGFGSSE
jgi:hypothetical protein